MKRGIKLIQLRCVARLKQAINGIPVPSKPPCQSGAGFSNLLKAPEQVNLGRNVGVNWGASKSTLGRVRNVLEVNQTRGDSFLDRILRALRRLGCGVGVGRDFRKIRAGNEKAVTIGFDVDLIRKHGHIRVLR